jgi:hypothetical protein
MKLGVKLPKVTSRWGFIDHICLLCISEESQNASYLATRGNLGAFESDAMKQGEIRYPAFTCKMQVGRGEQRLCEKELCYA